MAGKDDRLRKLGSMLSAVDDDALAALASVGLVRRAHKDLDAGEVTGPVEPTDAGVVVGVGERSVTIPWTGPANASCTCSAPGICRHALAAVMHLQRELKTDGKTPTTSAREQILAVTPKQLLKWAKTKAVREAAALLDKDPTVEMAEDDNVVVTFPDAGIQCHYFAGTGLEGMITNASGRHKYKFLVAAIMAFQRRHGAETEVPAASPSPSKPTAISRRQREVIATILPALADALSVGLTHLSGSVRERLDALAVSAQGADLPRLALQLRSLAQETELLLDRNAQADEGRMFSMLSQTWALAEAIAGWEGSVPPEILGQHRTRYDEFDRLELTGIAAWPWQTKSGHEGLTVLAWDERAHRWYTWSDSRPDHVTGGRFAASERYGQPTPWKNGQSPDRLSHSRFELTLGRRSGSGRLSSSGRCRVKLLGDAHPSKVDFGGVMFADWSELARRAAQVFPVGLEVFDALAATVVLKPAAWGRKTYDELSQTFSWTLFDIAGREIDLTLAYDEINSAAIDALQQTNPRWHGIWAVVGTIAFDSNGISVAPRALFGKRAFKGEQVWNVFFEDPSGQLARLAAQFLRPKLKTVMGAPETDEIGDFLRPWSTSVERVIAGMEDELLQLAERGCRRISSDISGRLATCSRTLLDKGLGGLAQASEGLTQYGQKDAGLAPGLVARARFICLVHRQVAARLGLKSMVKIP